jgi:hypothetical protein
MSKRSRPGPFRDIRQAKSLPSGLVFYATYAGSPRTREPAYTRFGQRHRLISQPPEGSKRLRIGPKSEIKTGGGRKSPAANIDDQFIVDGICPTNPV